LSGAGPRLSLTTRLSGGSFDGIDEVHAIDAARIEAALKSAAVTQGVENPVADENERQHCEKRGDVDESAVLEILLRLPARRRVEAIKSVFLRSIARQLSGPQVGLGRR
jgi:hypothetical protein